jgi:hypothetical protein
MYHSEDPIVLLLLDELVRPAGNALPPPEDLVAAVSDKFKKWDKSTFVSPFSQRYLNQYISLIRIIREPSINQAKPGTLPPVSQELASCYGNRAGLSAHEPVFIEELQNTICYFSRTNHIDQDNDATACYDMTPPNLANLVSRSNGMAQALCTVHGATLDGMSYHLLTALGISEEAHRNEPNSEVYGTGQGSTYPPRRGHRLCQNVLTPTENKLMVPLTARQMVVYPSFFTCSVSSTIKNTTSTT